jgi:hypothetical protein
MMGIASTPISQSIWITTVLPSVIASLITCIVATWFTRRYQKQWDEDAWKREKEIMVTELQRDLVKLHEDVKDELNNEREKAIREILDEIWKCLVKAYSSIRSITIPWSDNTDLDSWDDDHLEEFIKTLKFSDHDKEQLRNAEDKTKFYSNIKEKYDLMDVIINYGGFHNLVIDKSPHIPDELREKLIEIDQCVLLFLSRMQMQLYYDALYPIHSRNKIYTEFHEEADALYSEIEKLIRQNSNHDPV